MKFYICISLWMGWLDNIINSVDMNLSKLREIVKGREAWRATVHGVGHKDSDMTWQLNNTINFTDEDTKNQ